ncbi:MAG TPA: AAA family ATPase [Candidatus Omnitrophota bacterium]|nr:AAA family ATPase [Candidatus Omnitrophota bacterium]HPS37550.1 AAA family ATPase [Candidatus Omnitrophota bacterium]
MSYFKILGFEKEPFSTSPDPEFLYLSQGHQATLTNVLIELRLRRGLSVVLGDVGTGKTTLSRKLIQALKERGDFIVHYVLDPCFESEHQFLYSLVRNFGINLEQYGSVQEPGRVSVMDLKEAIEKFLYEKTVIGNKTVVLIVDEAQKLTETSIEMLRVILNYETNDTKLLQLVLFGQLELHTKIMKIPNFIDRISFKYTLNPLSLQETREMIHFRIKQGNYCSNARLFQDDAIEMIHKISHGYPRKITMLCHRALKQLVMKRKWAVDEEIVGEIVSEDMRAGWLSQTPH